MKLFSSALELKAIRTMAVSNGVQEDQAATSLRADERALASSLLLSTMNDSYFQYGPCKAAFRRLKKVAEKRSRVLDYDDLLEDSSLDEEFRDILREDKKKPAKTLQQAKDLLDQLDDYRKLRVAYSCAKDITEKLKETKVDPSEILNLMAGKLSEARARENLQDKIVTFGKGGDVEGLLQEVLDPTDEPLLATGFDEFDNRNGGLPAEGVFILAGTTSGGKSVIRMNLCEYMYYKNNLDVLSVSLEMNEKKEARRLASSLSRVPLWKFIKKALSKDDRKAVKRAWRDFYEHGEKNNCRYSLFCPTRSLSSRDLFTLLGPYKYKVVAIDYVGLLEGVDEKDQWKTLSAIVRQAKIYSSENHCLVIVLAQLDSEDDRIRYSKGMLEHADACWTWNYSRPEQRELKEIPMQQKKARDQELFPFVLKEEFEIMRVSNPDVTTSGHGSSQKSGEDYDGSDDDDKPRSKKDKKHKSGKSGKSKSRTSDDDDDEIKFEVD